MNPDQLFVATLYLSLPVVGLAIVKPIDSGANYRLATLPQSDTMHGAHPMDTYCTGQTVLCYKSYTSTDRLCHIVGHLNQSQTPLINSYNWRRLNNAEEFCEACEKLTYGWAAYRSLLFNRSDLLAHDYSHGADCDILPGDFDIIDRDSPGTGLHIGNLLAQLRGSALSFVETSSTNNQVRIVGETVKLDMPTRERVATTEYGVNNIAFNLAEALGCTGEGVRYAKWLSDEENLEANFDKPLLPFYRLSTTEGLLAEGRESLVFLPPIDPGTQKVADIHTSDGEIPTVLAKVRQATDGALSSASVQGIYSIKSPFIEAIHQVGYGGKPLSKRPEKYNLGGGDDDDDDDREQPKPTELSELREHYTKEATDEQEADDDNVLVSDEELTDDVMINRVISKLFSNEYSDKLRKLLYQHGFSVQGVADSAYGKIKKLSEDSSLKDGDINCSGPTLSQQYLLPKSVEYTDSITGKTNKYYDSLSCITQEPDGSVCICDGYGSEIRMSKGNIYISPALDLIMRPGRDLSVMACRYQSYNSQDACTVHSAKSVYIRADNDLKMSGGTDDPEFSSGVPGQVLIENRCSSGNIELKSFADVGITAQRNISLVRHDHKATGDSVTYPEEFGSIVMDAGHKGGCYMHGLCCTMDSSENVIVGRRAEAGEVTEAEGSALLVNSDSIDLMSKATLMNGTLYVGSFDGESPASVYTNQNGKSVGVAVSTGSRDSGGVFVDGNIIGTGNLSIEGMGLFKGNTNGGLSIIADTAAAVNVVGSLDKSKMVDTFKAVELPGIALDDSAGLTNSLLVELAALLSFNDAYIESIEFKYPNYADIYMHVMPCMLWQVRTMLYHNNVMATWKEPLLEPLSKGAGENPTACYPGYNVLSELNTRTRGMKLKPFLAGGYPMNTYKTN